MVPEENMLSDKQEIDSKYLGNELKAKLLFIKIYFRLKNLDFLLVIENP